MGIPVPLNGSSSKKSTLLVGSLTLPAYTAHLSSYPPNDLPDHFMYDRIITPGITWLPQEHYEEIKLFLNPGEVSQAWDVLVSRVQAASKKGAKVEWTVAGEGEELKNLLKEGWTTEFKSGNNGETIVRTVPSAKVRY
ncbi:hypothetical protein BT69DRAFT_834650 [Atractiella rhizophila]|nr:hypothetical protein BT69DRAFT_834650 [Atractiella rhizophila]